LNGKSKHHIPHILKFKTDRIAKEWESEKIPQKLRDTVILGAFYSFTYFKKPLVLTGIYRTPQEQYDIYKDNPAFIESPWKSNHQVWRAIDLRSRIYTPDEIRRLMEVFNSIPYRDGKKKTAVYHKVGDNSFHFHIQV